MATSAVPARLDGWINGSPVAGDVTYAVDNPFTAATVELAARLGGREAAAAIDACAAALGGWSGRSGNDRGNVLARAYERVRDSRSELAALLTREQGKTVKEADKEIRSMGAFIRFYAEEARRVGGEVVPSPDPRKRVLALRQPVGVVAALTAANFPGIMIGRKVAPALAAGCTVLLKPAEEAPGLAVRVAELFEAAGLPPGALNVVFGDAPAIADTLMADPRVRMVTFTGSAARGRDLMRKAADGLKRLVLELGGVAPFIVFDDADLAEAVDGLVEAKFRHAGQVCASPQRVLVHESVAAAFLESLTERLRTLAVGDPEAAGTAYGPLQNRRILEQVRALVDDAVGTGAVEVAGVGGGRGLVMPPVLLDGVSAAMAVSREEAFGPVVAVERFRDDEDAFRRANDTAYGLGAYVYTRSLARAWRAAEVLEAGVIGINDPFPATVEGPFGGVKQSGFGLEGGRYGIEEFLVTKQVSFRL